jgi:hypothetical protein
MKKNKIILSIFGILFLVYLFLYANEFEIRTRTEFWIIPTKMMIALILIFLLIILKAKWWLKLLSVIAFVGFTIFGLPQTGLWKYSLNRYVEKEKSEYINFVNEIDKISAKNLSYISCQNEQINSRPKLDSMEIVIVSKSICKFIDELDCVEVSLNTKKSKYLFVMSRFIDNGYGLLYCKDELNIDKIYDERINGLEITSILKVENKWYYVSFT